MVKRSIILGLFVALFAGCSQHGTPGAGNKILQTVGYLPPTKVVEGMGNLDREGSGYTNEEEYYLGRAVSAGILARYKLNNRAQITEYLNKVGLAVAAASDRPNTFHGYHFALINSDELNAFSAPGGFVFISRGLLERLKTEDELAAVFAHEVAHVEQRHGLQSISSENASNSLTKVGITAAALSCNAVLAQGVVVFGAAVDDILDRLLVSGFSKEQEYEADKRALMILASAGYRAMALLDVLEILHRQEGTSSGGWFATHPDPEARIVESRRIIDSEHITETNQGVSERAKRFTSSVSS